MTVMKENAATKITKVMQKKAATRTMKAMQEEGKHSGIFAISQHGDEGNEDDADYCQLCLASTGCPPSLPRTTPSNSPPTLARPAPALGVILVICG